MTVEKPVVLISLQRDLDTIGLKTLHMLLLRQGFESLLLYLPDLGAAEDARMLAVCDFVRSRSPLFVGIGLMSVEYARAAALTDHLKHVLPTVPVVWGGMHPTIAPEECLAHADYVCAGESETAVVALAEILRRGGDVSCVSSLCFLRDGVLIANPLAPLVEDVDALPVCDHLPVNAHVLHKNRVLPLDRTLLRKYARWSGAVYSIMGSRGCPYACSYCCNSTLVRIYGTRGIRRRSVDGIIAELERAVRDNEDIRLINFQDDCFLSCTEAYLEAFCDAYKRRVDRPFIVRSIPRFLTDKKLNLLKRAGLAWLTMGLQSGSDEINRDIFKRQATAADFLHDAALVHDAGIAAIYDVITDNPFESDAQRLMTIKTMMKTPKPHFVEVFSLTFYPGTELYERASRECPEALEDYHFKDNYQYRKTDLNHMMRLASYLGRRPMETLVALYQQFPKSSGFRLRLAFWRTMAVLFFEPVTYIRLIYMSEGASVGNMIRRVPMYARQLLDRYVKQL